MSAELLLERIARHVQLDKDEADLVIAQLQSRKLKRKEFLLKPGEVCRTENFILQGCLSVYTLDAKGSEHIIMFGVEGWWVSDLLSFQTDIPSTYFIEAVEDTEVLQLTKEDLDRLYTRIPKLERFFRIILQNAYIALQQRILQNISFTAEERYLDFIQKYPAFEQRIPQKKIASYLGVTPVFLSMLRKKLSRK